MGKITISITEEGYASFAEAVKQESHGGKVLLLTQEDRGEEAIAALSFAGVPTVRRKVTRAILSDHSLLTDRVLPEEVMAIVGVGGVAAIEGAKALPAMRHLPRILFPLDLSGLSALDDRAFFGTKADILILHADEPRVLLSPDLLSGSDHLREGLGILLARRAEEIDAAYQRLIEKGESPVSLLREIRERSLPLQEIREDRAAESLSLIARSEYCDAFRTDSAHILALLAAKSKKGSYPDYLFPAAYALIRLYVRYLATLPLEHCPPPDRSRNADLLKEYCSMDPSALLSRGKPYAQGYEERMRLTEEYREDFAETLAENIIPLSRLCRLYRRAKRSEEESDPLSGRELLALLSLTGEAVSGYPLLKHIKMTGLLEPLLLAS